MVCMEVKVPKQRNRCRLKRLTKKDSTNPYLCDNNLCLPLFLHLGAEQKDGMIEKKINK